MIVVITDSNYISCSEKLYFAGGLDWHENN